MDGENNGKPYEQMDDLGGKTTTIFGFTPVFCFQNRLDQGSPISHSYLHFELISIPRTLASLSWKPMVTPW